MLKTYSKEAIQNIKNYVCDNVDFTGYDKYAYIEKYVFLLKTLVICVSFSLLLKLF